MMLNRDWYDPGSAPAAHAIVGTDLEARVAAGDLAAGWSDRETL
jgi:hypothetical protein